LGGKGAKGEKVFFLHLPLTTKLGTFHWPPNLEPSIGHQVWNLPLATKLRTFHWPPSFRSTFTFLPLLFKRWAKIIERSLFPKTYFQSNIKDSCSYKFLKEGENDKPRELEKEGE
jgi:hypothetical protein